MHVYVFFFLFALAATRSIMILSASALSLWDCRLPLLKAAMYWICYVCFIDSWVIFCPLGIDLTFVGLLLKYPISMLL